jgi:single stranded DNA-binding protein
MTSNCYVRLKGFVGGEPEIHQTKGGKSFATFSLATNERYMQGGKWKESEPAWHRLTVWAQHLVDTMKHIKKGALVIAEGDITYSEFEDKSGTKCRSANIRVTHLSECVRHKHESNDDVYELETGEQRQ